MNRKDIFMTGFKSKLGFSFTHKDMEEFETIIDFYEKENAQLKDKIDKTVEYIKTNCKEWENDDYDVTLYYSLNQNECDELLEILKEN